jgi:hypothetical protein
MLNKYGPMTAICLAPFIGMATNEILGFVIIMTVFFYVG